MNGSAEQLTNRWLPIAAGGLAILIGFLAGFNPTLALVAAFGIAFVALTLLSLTAGVGLFAVLTFLDEVVPSGGLSLTKLMGVLLIVSWLAAITVGRERRRELFVHTPFLGVLMLFVLWAGMSALWAENSPAAVAATMRYAPNALLFLIVYAAMRTRDDALVIVGAYVAGTLISALYGVAMPSNGDVEGRLSGALGNANETATALAVGVALAGALALALRDNPWLRLGATIGVPICLISLFLTVSRGGLVALVAVLFAAIAVAGERRKVAVAFVAVAALGGVLYFTAIAPPQARDRIVQSDGGTGREDIWKVGWRMVEANPVLGVGAGNFPTSSVHYLLAPGAILRADFIVDDPKVAHNTYLEVLAELGVVGLVLFLCILGYSLVTALRAAKTFARAGDREMDIIARAIFVALVGMLVAAFFGSREFTNQLWLLLSMSPALFGVARMELAAAQARAAEQPAADVSGPRSLAPA